MKQKLTLAALLLTILLFTACKKEEEPQETEQTVTTEEETTTEDAVVSIQEFFYASQLYTISFSESINAKWDSISKAPTLVKEDETYPIYESAYFDSNTQLYHLTLNYGESFAADATHTYSGKLLLTATNTTYGDSTNVINGTYDAFTVNGTQVLNGNEKVQCRGLINNAYVFDVIVSDGKLINSGKTFYYNEQTRRILAYSDNQGTWSISGYQQGTTSDGTNYRIESPEATPMTLSLSDESISYLPTSGSVKFYIEDMTPVDNFTLTFLGYDEDGGYAMEVNYGGAIIPFSVYEDGSFKLGTISPESMAILLTLGFNPADFMNF